MFEADSSGRLNERILGSGEVSLSVGSTGNAPGMGAFAGLQTGSCPGHESLAGRHLGLAAGMGTFAG